MLVCVCVVLANCSSHPLKIKVRMGKSLEGWYPVGFEEGWGSLLSPSGLEILLSDFRGPLFTLHPVGNFLNHRLRPVEFSSQQATSFLMCLLLNIQKLLCKLSLNLW